MLGLALACWLGLSFFVAYRLTRRAGPAVAEPPPAVGWGVLRPVRLETRDGERLGGWFASGHGIESSPSVLLLHGNGGTRAQCVALAEIYAGEGCAVLLVTLRAHGDSSGEFNDLGLSARLDVVAAVDWLEAERPGRPVVVHGTSLGSAAAAFASAELGNRVGGYVLECPYRDLKTAVRNRTAEYLPAGLDLVAYLGLRAVAPVLLPDLDRIAPVNAVGGIPTDVPVLILAGGRDLKARPDEARAIHERIKGHSRLVLFERGGHLDLQALEPERYREEVVAFLRSVR